MGKNPNPFIVNRVSSFSLDESDSSKQVAISKEVKEYIRQLKSKEGFKSYDESLRFIINKFEEKYKDEKQMTIEEKCSFKSNKFGGE